MNPVTQSLMAGALPPQLIEFTQHWDALEALIIRVFRSKTATDADAIEHTQIRNWLQRQYPDWQAVLGVYWPHTKIAKQPAISDPFATLLAPEQANNFVDNWPIMQALPAARESLNRLIMDTRSESDHPTRYGYDKNAKHEQ